MIFNAFMKKYKVSPTIKQKKVFQEVMSGSSFRKAMVKAGYSIESATNPKNITNSEGWKQLTENFIPDDLLLRIHRAGLFSENPAIRHRYLETAYKIKGHYKDGSTPLNLNFFSKIVDDDRQKYA
jgi:hypothetical protein